MKALRTDEIPGHKAPLNSIVKDTTNVKNFACGKSRLDRSSEPAPALFRFRPLM